MLSHQRWKIFIQLEILLMYSTTTAIEINSRVHHHYWAIAIAAIASHCCDVHLFYPHANAYHIYLYLKHNIYYKPNQRPFLLLPPQPHTYTIYEELKILFIFHYHQFFMCAQNNTTGDVDTPKTEQLYKIKVEYFENR